MSYESNRTLGGVGAILLAIPFLNLVGIILVLIAMKGMAEHYNDDEIFKNTLYGFIFGVIGVIALTAVILMLGFGVAVVSPVAVPVGISILLVSIAVLYVFSLISAIFYRNALNNLSEKSGEQIFDTAGLVLLIGAIIPLIGEILKFVAWILAAVGFFSLKTPTQKPLAPSAPVAPPSISTEEKRFCRYCGAQIQVNAKFCQNCGKKID
jgi:uncharacterized membrane protein